MLKSVTAAEHYMNLMEIIIILSTTAFAHHTSARQEAFGPIRLYFGREFDYENKDPRQKEDQL